MLLLLRKLFLNIALETAQQEWAQYTVQPFHYALRHTPNPALVIVRGTKNLSRNLCFQSYMYLKETWTAKAVQILRQASSAGHTGLCTIAASTLTP